MSLLNDLLINLKDCFLKRSLYLIFTLFISVGTYIYAYMDGRSTAKCATKSQQENQKFRNNMDDYIKSIDKTYQVKINEIDKKYPINDYDHHATK